MISLLTSLCVEKALLSDISELLLIERSLFKDPWSRVLFEKELTFSCSRLYVVRDCICGGSEIMGYGCYRWTGAHADIMNLAVKEKFQHQGIGRMLIGYMINELKQLSVTHIYLEVRNDNTAALSLYRSCGFIIQRIRKHYYQSDGADAVEMCLKSQNYN